jgi:hypothetical protein
MRDSSLFPPCVCDGEMACPAEQPVVIEPAFPAAVGNREDVVGFPPGLRGAPGLARAAVGPRRLLQPPRAFGRTHVEPARLANAAVALLDFAANVRRTAADAPFVNARVGAEGPTGLLHQCAAPAADRLAGFVAFGFAPVVGAHGAASDSTHATDIGRTRAFLCTAPRAPA